MKRESISVVIPVYNEKIIALKKIIKEIKKTLRKLTNRFEIIIVDDGSREPISLNSFPERNHLKLIRHPVNVGKGSAIKSGISVSRGDLIVFIDSDLDIDVEYIQNYIEKSEMADIVIASKWHRDSKVEATLLRKLLSKSFHLLVEFFLRLGVKDTQTGLKVGKKKHLSKIFSNILIKKYAFDIEMLLMARLMRLKIIELPIKLKLKSKFKIKEIIRMLVDVLAVTYRLRVLRWYQRVLR